MAWALWLAVPLVVTVLVALATWWHARPARPPDVDQAMRTHQDYLDALTLPARGTWRVGTGGARGTEGTGGTDGAQGNAR